MSEDKPVRSITQKHPIMSGSPAPKVPMVSESPVIEEPPMSEPPMRKPLESTGSMADEPPRSTPMMEGPESTIYISGLPISRSPEAHTQLQLGLELFEPIL